VSELSHAEKAAAMVTIATSGLVGIPREPMTRAELLARSQAAATIALAEAVLALVQRQEAPDA
jgi:hypothetical protein